MNALRIIDGRVVSGHFIYVRDSGTLSDVAFLSALGLHGYAPDKNAQFPCHFAHILRASDWSGYADDWFYTAYNISGIRDAVTRLAKTYEVLRLSIGDSDQSIEIYHFIDGSLRRGFHFHDYAGKSSVKLNRGTPLKCESAFQPSTNPSPLMWAAVDEIGIDSRTMAAAVSTYSKPYQKR